MAHLAWMIDLETLALTSDAVVVSVGACCCDLEKSTFDIVSEYYSAVYVNETQSRRALDISTVNFWLKQSEEARAVFVDPNKKTVYEAVQDIIADMVDFKPTTVWSKGVDFDIPIIEHVLKQMGWPVPWTYKQRMCYRTVAEIHKSVMQPIALPQFKHHALRDAKYQLLHLWAIYQSRVFDVKHVWTKQDYLTGKLLSYIGDSKGKPIAAQQEPDQKKE